MSKKIKQVMKLAKQEITETADSLLTKVDNIALWFEHEMFRITKCVNSVNERNKGPFCDSYFLELLTRIELMELYSDVSIGDRLSEDRLVSLHKNTYPSHPFHNEFKYNDINHCRVVHYTMYLHLLKEVPQIQ